jgi:hypothetical protein
MQESRDNATGVPCVSRHLCPVTVILINIQLMSSRIFVADRYESIFTSWQLFIMSRSGSMSCSDRHPLPNTPASARIIQRSNNRFGAVLSSLYSFWSARAAAVAGPQAARRDSYSIILFDNTIADVAVNDFTSSPDQLLDATLRYSANGGTNFTAAVRRGQSVMEQQWSTERCVDDLPKTLYDLQ